MNKIYFSILFAVTAIFCSQSLYAHGVGGGSGSSYDFDSSNRAAARDAEKKVVEKKREQDDWAEFMKSVNRPKKENEVEKVQDQDDGHHDRASHKQN
jgi:hypothetical protein